jgi:hypothetical protein
VDEQPSGQGPEGAAQGAEGAESQHPEGGVSGNVNPEMQQRLSDENARRRKENQTLRQQLEAWQQLGASPDEIRAKLTTGADSGNADSHSPGGARGELATVRREMAQLRDAFQSEVKRREAAEAAARESRANETLATVTGSLKLTDAETAMEVLAKRTKVADDGEVVFLVRDSAGQPMEVPATAEAVIRYKILSPIFFQPAGKPGMGQAGAGGVSDGNGGFVDLERAQNDFAYYDKHRDKIQAALKQQQG